MRIGKNFGKPIKLDQATSFISRGKFARVYVEIAITKPLLTSFRLRDKIWQIEYEGLHLVYLVVHQIDRANDTTVDLNNNGNLEKNEAMDNRIENKENYGSWMLGIRKPRKNQKHA